MKLSSENIRLVSEKKSSTTKAALLFHGMSSTAAEMSSLADFLHDKGFDVFVPCLSGHGTSIEEFCKTPSSQWIEDAETAFSEVSAAGYERLYCAGQSFGSLLTCYLASAHPESFSAVSLLSPPFALQKSYEEWGLYLLSFLSDSLLNRLGVVKKSARREGALAHPRVAYEVHSIAAGARMIQVRRRVLAQVSQLSCPHLILQDPKDHMVSSYAPGVFLSGKPKGETTLKWVMDGEHELTLGHSYESVCSEVCDFFESHL